MFLKIYFLLLACSVNSLAWQRSSSTTGPSKTTTATANQSRSQAPAPIFKDIGASAGLTVAHISSPEKRYVIESMSGGVGLFDCDNDGKLDIVVVNGSTVDRYRKGGDLMVTLYHQGASLKF